MGNYNKTKYFKYLLLIFIIVSCSKSILPEYRNYKKDGVNWYEKKIYCYPEGKYPSTKGKRKLAIIQQYKGSWLYESKVFYELWPNGESKFVSKEGFYKYKNGEYQLLIDSIIVPDNIICSGYDSIENSINYFYLNDKKVLYTLGEMDGVKSYIYKGDKPGVYIWENGKKEFLREFKENEKPKIIKLK